MTFDKRHSTFTAKIFPSYIITTTYILGGFYLSTLPCVPLISLYDVIQPSRLDEGDLPSPCFPISSTDILSPRTLSVILLR